MITEVILPKLGQTMEEGSVVEWVKKEGDPVKRGDLLFTVESDKAVLDVEATARGFLRKILVAEGQVVPVLTTVALITRAADEDISSLPALLIWITVRSITSCQPSVRMGSASFTVSMCFAKYPSRFSFTSSGSASRAWRAPRCR